MSGTYRAGLRIDLKTPAIFSAAAATTGGHASLDGIPGSALLGLAASWQDLWQEFVEEPVWTVLRSGIVRFGSGFLVDAAGRVLLPVPRSLHTIKASTAGSVEDPSKLHNLASGIRIQGKQFAQLREGFLADTDAGLKMVRSRKVFAMKTAVDPEKGTALDSMLFGYEALAAGQSFYAEIEADADRLDATAFEDLVMALAGSDGRDHRIGRSRSAEFGSVTIRKVPARKDETVRLQDDKLLLWALSDVALVDRYGQPTLDPAMADLGFEDLTYCPECSFLGTRRYTPYVGRWRCSDLERQVISAGSVIVFKGKGTRAAAARLHASGMGVDRAAGLGCVWVNPTCLDSPDVSSLPLWHQLSAAPPDGRRPAPPNDNPLYAWLDARAGKRSTRDTSDTAVDGAAKKILAAYTSSAAYSGLRPDGFPGPSRSQWNQVGGIARDARDLANLKRDLFGTDGLVSGRQGHHGELKSDPAWGWRIDPGRDHAANLKSLIDGFEALGVDVPRALAATAQRVATLIGGSSAGPIVAAERKQKA